MLKNWTTIGQIKDRAVRLAILNCRDPETLSRLYAGFLECFLPDDTPEEQVGLMVAAIRDAIIGDDSDGDPPEVCVEDLFGVPHRHFAHPSWVEKLREESNAKDIEEMTDEMTRMWPTWNEVEGYTILKDPIVQVDIDGRPYLLLYCYEAGEGLCWEAIFIPAEPSAA